MPPTLRIASEFTRAFQHAADRIQARATFDHFDGSGKRRPHKDMWSEIRFFFALQKLRNLQTLLASFRGPAQLSITWSMESAWGEPWERG